jgi:mono/diheme cytochrome c family protein
MKTTNWLLAALIACAGLGSINVQTKAETLLERGTYLMQGIVACGNCHTPRNPDGSFIEGMELAGGFTIEEPVFTAHAPNITPDAETGIGGWTDAELIKAIREGLRPDGSLIGPPMPFSQYRGIADRDVEAIVAYLRKVPPVQNTVPASEYRIPLPPAWGPPVGNIVAPSPADDLIAYGAYLSGPLGHCVECHTPMTNGRFEFETKLAAGGLSLPIGPDAHIVSANITPDIETGIGSWSDVEIAQAITSGVRPDGSQIHPLMPYGFYANMTLADVVAVVAYLRSLPPVVNDVK